MNTYSVRYMYNVYLFILQITIFSQFYLCFTFFLFISPIPDFLVFVSINCTIQLNENRFTTTKSFIYVFIYGSHRQWQDGADAIYFINLYLCLKKKKRKGKKRIQRCKRDFPVHRQMSTFTFWSHLYSYSRSVFVRLLMKSIKNWILYHYYLTNCIDHSYDILVFP